MKSFVLVALVARVASQENVSCVIPEGDDLWENKSVYTDIEITDAASCKKAVDADVKDILESMPDPENVDLCYHAAVQAASGDVEASAKCFYFERSRVPYDPETGGPKEGAEPLPPKDIRVETAPKDGLVYTAWAWSENKQLADLAAAAETSADSANMIASTLAAFATIAMVAY